MATWVTRHCDCTQTVYSGQKREKVCGCGNVFENADVIARQREKAQQPRRRSVPPDRFWDDARAKVDEEGCCRICKRPPAPGRPIEAAHVLGREHDEPMVSRSTGEILRVLYVDPNRIFPACGPSPGGCHGMAERKEINVLPYLTLEEELQAIRDAGSIEAARIRLEPVTHNNEVREAAVR